MRGKSVSVEGREDGRLFVNTMFASRDEIHRLQLADGHEPCFGSERGRRCAEADCPWRRRCAGLVAHWMR